ncbi:MAG: coenzyme F420-0:L-glutamate ligase, partial [Chloroflexi bacterium]|nr:coenzyme F420-0:L-glutamate ligase [Chloroflexota bacterium]
MPPEIRVIGVEGIPEIQAGDDLASLVMDAAQGQNTSFQAGDIIVVTQKIISKAEGR